MLRIIAWRLLYHFLCALKLAGFRGARRKYFAFGANLDPEVLGHRNMHPRDRTEYTLEGYRLGFDHAIPFEGMGMASIQPSTGDKVYGVIYTLDLIDVWRMNCLESCYFLNRHTTQTLDLPNGERFYFYRSLRLQPGLRPSQVYLNKILNGYRFLHQVDSAYLAQLKNTPTVTDRIPLGEPHFMLKNYSQCGAFLRPLLTWYDKQCMRLFTRLIFKPSFFEKRKKTHRPPSLR